MEPERPLTGHGDPQGGTMDDDELDARFDALFESIESPSPTAGFAARAMRAVKLAPLPPGRQPLRSPLASLVGWAAVISAVATLAWSIASSQPVFASSFSTLIINGLGIGFFLTQFVSPALALLEVLTTTGLAVSRAAVTTEGAAGLALIAVMGAVSLSALHRVLMSEGEGSSWQELS